MLVLSRKVGEKIRIGSDISITVVKVGNNGVRLGVEAPFNLPVMREELMGTSIDDVIQESTDSPSE